MANVQHPSESSYSDFTAGTTSSHYATNSGVRSSTLAEHPLRTRDRDDRDRSNRKENRSVGLARNNSGNMMGPARLDRASSIPVSSAVSEVSPMHFFGFKLPWSSTAAPTKRAPELSSKPLRTSTIDLEDYFLQPSEDSSIHKAVEGLKHSIASHVYNYYSGIENPPPDEVIIDIVNPDNDDWRAPIPPLSEESFRLGVIRLSIARFMLERIVFDGDLETTFLPTQVVSLLGMASSHHTEKFRFAASAILRRTAANLLRLTQPGESEAFTRMQELQIERAVDDLHDRLSRLANPESDAVSRKRQLKAIMNQSARIGVKLLLQPATYEFEWFMRTPTRHGSGEQIGRRVKRGRQIKTFPAILKTGDDKGRQLRRPEALCKSEYMEEE